MLQFLDSNLKHLYLVVTLFFITYQVNAQFTITDNFKGSTVQDVIIGDDAKLTSGDEDPINAGWLRLTNDGNNRKGYAYVNKSFPSTLGVLIDFEYIQWRTRADNTYQGADGISVFLFDAQYGPGNFQLGAYGGSLGYANKSNPTEPGVTGGYVGIGLDAYGNFARASENKNGGPSGLSPNSIVFRGPTTNNYNTTNPYLKGITVLQNGNIVDAMNSAGNAHHDVVDYNTVTSTRPTYQQFYRRVQVEIIPTGTGFYDINEIMGATSANYQPGNISKTTAFRRITVATGNTTCESEASNVITITTKNCMLITNPNIYQKTDND